MTINQDAHIGVLYTASGTAFKPLEPDPELINIFDIARSLSNISRYGGHTQAFYSVAEHSYRIVDRVSPQNAKWALLHDASEAYLGDIPSPLKYHEHFSFYLEAERVLMEAICEKFNLPLEIPEEVEFWDKEIRREEMVFLTNIPEKHHRIPGDDIWNYRRFWPSEPEKAYTTFLEYARFLNLI